MYMCWSLFIFIFTFKRHETRRHIIIRREKKGGGKPTEKKRHDGKLRKEESKRGKQINYIVWRIEKKRTLDFDRRKKTSQFKQINEPVEDVLSCYA